MLTFRLAFIGAAGSGKTTMAKAMVERHTSRTDNTLKLSFANALRWEVACSLEPRDRDLQQHYLDQMLNAETKAPYRSVLQAWGELRRDLINPDYWCDIVDHDIERAERAYDPALVIDDCRYPNEYEMLKRRNFEFVRCNSPKAPDNVLTLAQASHSSEAYHVNMEVSYTLPYMDELNDRIEMLENYLGFV